MHPVHLMFVAPSEVDTHALLRSGRRGTDLRWGGNGKGVDVTANSLIVSIFETAPCMEHFPPRSILAPWSTRGELPDSVTSGTAKWGRLLKGQINLWQTQNQAKTQDGYLAFTEYGKLAASAWRNGKAGAFTH